MDSLPPNLTLDALINMERSAEVRPAVPHLRSQMIWEAGCSVGAQGGLMRRSGEIRQQIEAHAMTLDRFNFQPLMTAEGMLPPVVSEERDAARQEGWDQKRVAGVVYRIVREARLVMTAPTWRDYLYQGLPMPVAVEQPHVALLPQNDAERIVWRDAVRSCWDAGTQQAEAAFSENVSRFERDYLGMVRYKMLYTRGMVEGLRVGTEIKAVTGGKHEMFIDDRLIKITGSGGLVPDIKKWK